MKLKKLLLKMDLLSNRKIKNNKKKALLRGLFLFT